MKRILFIIILIIFVATVLFFVFNKININMNTIIPNNNSVSEIKDSVQYGEKVRYEKGIAVQFPDFTLTYTGDRWLSGKNGATWSMVFNLFNISDGKNSKEVSWSSGTGNIVPNPFEFNGKRYSIERALSDKFGQLKQDELIINVEK
jgi:hypothetical protein